MRIAAAILIRAVGAIRELFVVPALPVWKGVSESDIPPRSRRRPRPPKPNEIEDGDENDDEDDSPE